MYIFLSFLVLIPQWETNKDVDDFTDDVYWTSMLQGSNNSIDLLVGCSGPLNHLMFDSKSEIRGDQPLSALSNVETITVEIRYDDSSIITERFAIGKGARLLIAIPDRIHDIIESMMLHRRLRIRVYDANGDPVQDSFDVSGLRPVMDEMGCYHRLNIDRSLE